MFPVFDPKPEHIRLLDIAHGLSNECRWQGMCRRAFNVAEHSIWVARMSLNKEDKIHSLLHDAHEAYLSDIPKPLKENFPLLLEAANKIDDCIYESLKLKKPDPEAKKRIHLADEYSAWVEGRTLFVRDPDDPWSPGTRPPDDLDEAREMYYALQGEPESLYRIRESFLAAVALAL